MLYHSFLVMKVLIQRIYFDAHHWEYRNLCHVDGPSCFWKYSKVENLLNHPEKAGIQILPRRRDLAVPRLMRWWVHGLRSQFTYLGWIVHTLFYTVEALPCPTTLLTIHKSQHYTWLSVTKSFEHPLIGTSISLGGCTNSSALTLLRTVLPKDSGMSQMRVLQSKSHCLSCGLIQQAHHQLHPNLL